MHFTRSRFSSSVNPAKNFFFAIDILRNLIGFVRLLMQITPDRYFNHGQRESFVH